MVASGDDERSDFDRSGIVAALDRVVAKGLPTSEDVAGVLLGLRGVRARSVVPSEPRSRLQALNELLPRLIGTIGDSSYRDALQTMFGLAAGTRQTSLMARRRQAADNLGYSASHFRNEVEASLIAAVADLLIDDSLRYMSRVHRSEESLEATGTTPRLGLEHLTHHEELISRIWQHVYWLRAELIAAARLAAAEGFDAQAEDHRQAATRAHAGLRTLIDEFVSAYGEQLIRHGDAEFAVEALERLAGWE